MAKYLFISILVLATFASLTCCKMFGQKRKGNAMEINYSGEKLAVNDIQGEELFQLLQTNLIGCSDIYELIVTNKIIDDIKKENEQGTEDETDAISFFFPAKCNQCPLLYAYNEEMKKNTDSQGKIIRPVEMGRVIRLAQTIIQAAIDAAE